MTATPCPLSELDLCIWLVPCSCRVGYRSQRCAEPGCDRLHHLPNGYCLDRSAAATNGHTGASSPMPPLLGLCQHHTVHPHQSLPPPDLLWDRQQGPQHYLHRSCSEGPLQALVPISIPGPWPSYPPFWWPATVQGR
ncbi:hypothetical protein SRHO_G00152840 [Serrasalmus rhombeus]